MSVASNSRNSTLFKEIGGNFWLRAEQLNYRPVTPDIKKYISGDGEAFFTSSGRGAITAILSDITTDRKTALLPLYTCDSVIQPFINKGYQVYFYNIAFDLAVDLTNLIDQITAVCPGIILFHSYFGFDTLSEVRQLFPRLRESGIVVIEDVTHSLFSGFDKAGADYYCASLRKWLEIPDGGFAFSKENRSSMHEIKYAVNPIVTERFIKASLLKDRYVHSMDAKLKSEYRKWFYSIEDILAANSTVYSMSDVASAIWANTDFKEVCRARRNNYSFLYENIMKSDLLYPVFGGISNNVVPLYLPVYIKGDRSNVQTFFSNHDIYSPIHWPIPNLCKEYITQSVSYIYNQILSIPCDQRYSLDDMRRIVEVLDCYN